jgi:hypothetical protein
MQYMLMFYETETEFAKRDDSAAAPAYWGAWNAYIGAMNAAGIVLRGDGLLPPGAATTVRVEDGERLVQDGPVSATKEQLGGYFVIEVDTLDDALAWAARSPNLAAGATEVRPVLPPPPQV